MEVVYREIGGGTLNITSLTFKRYLPILGVALAYSNIAAAQDRVQATFEEGTEWLGASIGLAAGAAVASSVCGPGAPLCAAIAIAGGAVFGVEAMKPFNQLFDMAREHSDLEYQQDEDILAALAEQAAAAERQRQAEQAAETERQRQAQQAAAAERQRQAQQAAAAQRQRQAQQAQKLQRLNNNLKGKNKYYQIALFWAENSTNEADKHYQLARAAFYKPSPPGLSAMRYNELKQAEIKKECDKALALNPKHAALLGFIKQIGGEVRCNKSSNQGTLKSMSSFGGNSGSNSTGSCRGGSGSSNGNDNNRASSYQSHSFFGNSGSSRGGSSESSRNSNSGGRGLEITVNCHHSSRNSDSWNCGKSSL